MYTAVGRLVIGAPGREAVITSERTAAVSYAALQIAIDDLLRGASMKRGCDEAWTKGIILMVSVSTSPGQGEDGRLSLQRVQDAKRAEEEILRAELHEGELGARWTIVPPKERTHEQGG